MQVLEEGRDICIYLSKMVWFHLGFISKFAQKNHPHNMNIRKCLEHLQMLRTSPVVWTQRSFWLPSRVFDEDLEVSTWETSQVSRDFSTAQKTASLWDILGFERVRRD